MGSCLKIPLKTLKRRKLKAENLKCGKLNGERGTRDIEGKVTRVGASECGQRASFKS